MQRAKLNWRALQRGGVAAKRRGAAFSRMHQRCVKGDVHRLFEALARDSIGDLAMNTPRRTRRYDPATVFEKLKGERPQGHFVHTLQNEEYAKKFAAIVSEFEVVESQMPRLLAALLGMSDAVTAGYLYRKLRSPNIRMEVLRDLLENAPNNRELGDDFDNILSDYDKARNGRNKYVHGLWFTGDDKRVYFARSDEHGYGFMLAEHEAVESLDDLLGLIRSILGRLVMLRLGDPPQFVRPRHPPPPASPK